MSGNTGNTGKPTRGNTGKQESPVAELVAIVRAMREKARRAAEEGGPPFTAKDREVLERCTQLSGYAEEVGMPEGEVRVRRVAQLARHTEQQQHTQARTLHQHAVALCESNKRHAMLSARAAARRGASATERARASHDLELYRESQRLVERAAEVVEQAWCAVQEAVVPNKVGHGCHDDKTGYPASCHGEQDTPQKPEGHGEQSKHRQLTLQAIKQELEKRAEAKQQGDSGSAGQSQSQSLEDAAADYQKNGTRAKAFKDWFRGSKVVDENGEPQENYPAPLIVYHGTNRQFDQFDLARSRSELNDEFQGDGLFFTPDPRVAEDYANAARNQHFNRDTIETEMREKYPGMASDLFTFLLDKGYGDGFEAFQEKYPGTISEITEKMKEQYGDNAPDMNDIADVTQWVEGTRSRSDSGDDISASALFGGASGMPEYILEKIREWGLTKSDLVPKIIPVYLKATKILKTSDREKAKAARANGYDGVLYSGSGTVKGVPEWIVFDAHQIKAVANRGTFNPNSPKIHEAIIPNRRGIGCHDSATGHRAVCPPRPGDKAVDEQVEELQDELKDGKPTQSKLLRLLRLLVDALARQRAERQKEEGRAEQEEDGTQKTTEAVVPNKRGKGCHDDKTGHPAACHPDSGSTAKKSPAKRTETLAAIKAELEKRAKATTPKPWQISKADYLAMQPAKLEANEDNLFDIADALRGAMEDAVGSPKDQCIATAYALKSLYPEAEIWTGIYQGEPHTLAKLAGKYIDVTADQFDSSDSVQVLNPDDLPREYRRFERESPAVEFSGRPQWASQVDIAKRFKEIIEEEAEIRGHNRHFRAIRDAIKSGELTNAEVQRLGHLKHYPRLADEFKATQEDDSKPA